MKKRLDLAVAVSVLVLAVITLIPTIGLTGSRQAGELPQTARGVRIQNKVATRELSRSDRKTATGTVQWQFSTARADGEEYLGADYQATDDAGNPIQLKRYFDDYTGASAAYRPTYGEYEVIPIGVRKFSFRVYSKDVGKAVTLHSERQAESDR